jgi:hypothetical protein
MGAEVDHVFVCCSVGGPEADALVRLGLREGAANTHPGQGTACRRFFFTNAYLELLWVSDPEEAQAASVRPTRLWQRWSQRSQGACPFGIVLRPLVAGVDTQPPFVSWPYRPSYMPPGVAIDVARDTPLTDPEFFYLRFRGDRSRVAQEPVDHDLPVRSLTGITVWRPAGPGSDATKALQAAGLVVFRDAAEYLMELRFDEPSRGSADLRPMLPLALRW